MLQKEIENETGKTLHGSPAASRQVSVAALHPEKGAVQYHWLDLGVTTHTCKDKKTRTYRIWRSVCEVCAQDTYDMTGPPLEYLPQRVPRCGKHKLGGGSPKIRNEMVWAHLKHFR
jgi:hypothetical protein